MMSESATSVAGAFLSRKLRLGTSLFLPSTMPASYQPVVRSLTWIACLRSTGFAQPAATRAASVTSARPRMMLGFSRKTGERVNSQLRNAQLPGHPTPNNQPPSPCAWELEIWELFGNWELGIDLDSELPFLHSLHRLRFGDAAREVVGEIAALDAQHPGVRIAAERRAGRRLATAQRDRQPLVRLHVEVLAEIEHRRRARVDDCLPVRLIRIEVGRVDLRSSRPARQRVRRLLLEHLLQLHHRHFDPDIDVRDLDVEEVAVALELESPRPRLLPGHETDRDLRAHLEAARAVDDRAGQYAFQDPEVVVACLQFGGRQRHDARDFDDR